MVRYGAMILQNRDRGERDISQLEADRMYAVMMFQNRDEGEMFIVE